MRNKKLLQARPTTRSLKNIYWRHTLYKARWCWLLPSLGINSLRTLTRKGRGCQAESFSKGLKPESCDIFPDVTASSFSTHGAHRQARVQSFAFGTWAHSASSVQQDPLHWRPVVSDGGGPETPTVSLNPGPVSSRFSDEATLSHRL